MKMKKNHIITLEQFKDKNYGNRGTTVRDKLENGYKNFKLKVLIHSILIKKGGLFPKK